MPSGTLQVYAAVAGQSAPLAGVTVTVYDENGARLARVQTDGQGMAPELTLDAPDRALSLDESNTTVRPYAVYQLTAVLAGWQEQSLAGVQVFDGQQTVARLDLLPADTALAAARQGPVVIPEHVLFAGGGGSGRPPADRQADPRVLTEVVIPRRITVHTVPFQEYIANVASSEVYPTWEGHRSSQTARQSIRNPLNIRQLSRPFAKNYIIHPCRAIALPPGPIFRVRRFCLVSSS